MLSRSEKKLFSYIQNDNLFMFSESYLNNESIRKDALNSEDSTFIGESVKRGAIEIANFLLNEEPELLHSVDGRGNHPLSYIGILEPNRKMIELFESKGFDISLDLGGKGNILHVIAPRGKVDLYKELVGKGANSFGVNGFGERPIDIAKRFGNNELLGLIKGEHKQAELDL